MIEQALAARGLSEASLIADWPAIVGESVARYARPLQLQWPPRPAKRDPEAPIAPATLVLRVDGAFALEAQHSAAIIVERVNAHLGWRCVGKDRVPPGAAAAAEGEAQALPPPSEAGASGGAARRRGDRGRGPARGLDAVRRARHRPLGAPIAAGGGNGDTTV